MLLKNAKIKEIYSIGGAQAIAGLHMEQKNKKSLIRLLAQVTLM